MVLRLKFLYVDKFCCAVMIILIEVRMLEVYLVILEMCFLRLSELKGGGCKFKDSTVSAIKCLLF